MKKLGVFLLGGIGMLISNYGLSQGLEETALLFSRTTFGGSARMQGMGGVQVGLGGDFSSATSNPAGLGMYNRFEVTISPVLTFVNNKASYFGDTTNGFKVKGNIQALSFVFHRKKEDDRKFRGTFGITFNRINDFNSKIEYKGYNPNNSIADYYAINTDGLNPEDLQNGGASYNTIKSLAFEQFVIDTIWNSNTSQYNYLSAIGINYFDSQDVPDMLQQETIVTSGGQNQTVFSFGGNIIDKFFFGISLNYKILRFTSRKVYSESDFYFASAPSYDPIDQLILKENLEIYGSGYSATFGAIVRPFDFVQIGVSYQTPTTYWLKDTYSASLETQWNSFDYYGNGSMVLGHLNPINIDDIVSEYNLKTPGRLAIGLTGFLGKAGLISAEVDMIDYKKASYTSRISGIDYYDDNEIISSLYKTTVNFRFGGEFRIKVLRFRAGFGRMSDPYKHKQDNVSRSVTNLSLGAGIRKQHFFLDAAILFKTNQSTYKPYNLPNDFSPTPIVDLNNQTASLLFTIGFPF